MADEITQEQYPEVVKGVLAEIKTLGTNVKKEYDTLRTNYEDLKKLIDEREKNSDVLIDTRIQKYVTDLTVRQEDLDKKAAEATKKFNDRIDQFEIAMKRPGGASGRIPSEEEEKHVKQFYSSIYSLKEDGLSWEKMKGLTMDTVAYRAYCDAFVNFIRKSGDERNLSPDMHKALIVGSDPAGGYTVTPQMLNSIITRQWEIDPIRQLATVEQITTGALEQLVDWDEAGAGWEAETVAQGETTTPKLNKKRIDVFVASARPRASQSLLDDSGINIEQWLSKKIADRLARLENAAFVSGDGVGKPRGFLTYGNGTVYGTVQQVNMGHATLLTADGFILIKYALNEFYLNSNNLAWLMARSSVAAAMQLKNGAGDYIWKPGILATDPNSTILGIPVRMSPNIPAVAANALSIVLADWKEAYTIVDRQGISVQRDPYTVKPFVEFYTRKRVGGDIVNYDAIKIGVVHV